MGVRRAILSVTDKTRIVPFARGLAGMGVQILSTGGTAGHLRSSGVPVTEVSDYTGFPEILGGRVKTLHPKVFGGILLPRGGSESDRSVAERLGVEAIDLVAVNLYPFRDAVARGVSFDDAMEEIDIGGVSLLRAAAKNHRRVVVVAGPHRYDEVLERLASGTLDEAYRRELAREAFAHTAAYDAAIEGYLTGEGPAAMPRVLNLSFEHVMDLRCGENPHQRAALYRDPSVPSLPLLGSGFAGGKGLSFNNILDADAAFRIVRGIRAPAAVVVKHGTPCGAAAGPSLADSCERARGGDPVSAFGGIVGLNRPVDLEVAEVLARPDSFTEVIVLPEIDPQARERIVSGPRWGRNVRILPVGDGFTNPLPGGFDLRTIPGGILVQDRDGGDPEPVEWRSVTERAPEEREMGDLVLAWHLVQWVRSNAITIVKDACLVGVGGGQTSRVDAVRIAGEKAGDRARGAVLASDGFFPFPDGVEEASAWGVTAVIQPGGSRRDPEVIEAANRRGMAMVFTGIRHFRH